MLPLKEKLKSLLPLLCGYLGYILWGFSNKVISTALGCIEELPGSVLLSHRFVVSCIIMLVLVATRLVKVNFRNKKWGSAALLVTFQFAYYLFETATTRATNSSVSSLVSAVSPVLAIVLAAIFLKEYPSTRQKLFCILPVAGVILMVVAGAGEDMKVITSVTPVILLTMAIFTSGAYRTINRSASRYFTAFERTLILFIFSSVANTILALGELDWNVDAYIAPLKIPTYLYSMLFLSVVCSLVCNLLVNYATANLPVVKISSLGALTTVVGVLVGLLTGDPWNPMFLVGSVLIVVGIWQVTKVPKVKEESTTK